MRNRTYFFFSRRSFGAIVRWSVPIGTNLFVLFFCFFFVDADRRPAKWRVTPLGTDPKWRIDQRIRTEKSFPVSPFRFHCQRKSFRSIRFRITVSNEGEKKKLTRLVMWSSLSFDSSQSITTASCWILCRIFQTPITSMPATSMSVPRFLWWSPCFLCLIITFFIQSEYTETERLHSDSRSQRAHHRRLLAINLAVQRQLHRHVDQNVRLHQGASIQPFFNLVWRYFTSPRPNLQRVKPF